MKYPKSQSGFTALHILLLLLLLGIIGFAGWKVYDANKTAMPTTSSNAPTPAPTASKIPDGFVEYQNKELGFKFAYPKEWGKATMKQGELVSPAHGDYKQVIFDNKSDININFVIGGASSPLDGCPAPVYAKQHQLAFTRASVIGWDEADSLLNYSFDYTATVNSNTSVYSVTKSPRTLDGKDNWIKVRAKDNALAYRAVNTYPTTVNGDDSACGAVTQKEADEANAYYKYVHFARSFKTPKVLGVNAEYDARTKQDSAIIDQVLATLNSLREM